MLDIREIEYWISRYENEASKLDDCVVLAALYSIRDNLNGVKPVQRCNVREFPVSQPQIAAYSEISAPADERLGRYGDSDFLRAVEGLEPETAWSIVDDHMNQLYAVNRKWYESLLSRFRAARKDQEKEK